MRLAPALFRTSVWLSSVLVAGCGLLRSHEDTTHGEDAVYRISGRISVDEERGVPIVVALLRTQPGTPELVVTDHTQLFHSGSYEFLVSAGRYRIVVFEDADHDLSFDDDERHLDVGFRASMSQLVYQAYVGLAAVNAVEATSLVGLDF